MAARDYCFDSEIKHMKIHSQQRCVPLLVVLVVALLLAACASGSTTSTKPVQRTITPPPTQPVSGQQLLAGPVTYVALGASDAVGVGSNEPGAQGYVPLLAQKLPQGSHPIDLGVSGIHLHEALSEELPIALSTSPKLVTIWLVANDFIANVSYNSYMQDLNTLLAHLRSGTQARIVMANLPDLTLLPIFSSLKPQQKTAMQATIKRWNTNIASIAAHYSVTVVDLLAQASLITAHPNYISRDGFHPNALGYAQLANLFWQAIRG